MNVKRRGGTHGGIRKMNGMLLSLIFWSVCLHSWALGKSSVAGDPTPLSPEVAQYVKINAPVIALTHVRLIDGTGAPAREDQTVVVDRGYITAVGASAATTIPAGAEQFDYSGHTIIPGIVGMHNHLFFPAPMVFDDAGHLPPPGYIVVELPFSAPHLYLAAGVTTIRTTGSFFPDTDINIKHLIDNNRMPGPKIHVTGPYLDGATELLFQSHVLTGPEDARRRVSFYADDGFTSWKLYMNITRAEMQAVIEEAHKRHMKVTGHLCSVTWREAIALGIDDFEHGPVYTDTEFVSDKAPDSCPSGTARMKSWANLDVNGPQVQSLIKDLVDHHVAVTSTLPVFVASSMNERPPSPRAMQALAPESRNSYLLSRAQTTPEDNAYSASFLKKEVEFEHAFFKAGGLLLAGPDPTGSGGVLPGFGDWREIEMLVEGGFTPLEAIHVATQNGADFLGESDKIGTLAVGKQADIAVIKGDPSKNIKDIEQVVLVFKDGVGYDSLKLFDSVKGLVGIK